jgi:hypothetical protein
MANPKATDPEMARFIAMTPFERTEYVMSQIGLTYGGTGSKRGQTIGDYFGGIKSKRDEDERRAAAQGLARAEEEEWLGVGEQPLSPWGQRMLGQGWVELTPGNWMPPEEAHAMDVAAPSFDYYEAPPAVAQYRKNAAQQYLNKDWPEW